MPELHLPPQANLLAEEGSPYLQQHADNPVHWRAWGAPALAEAHALQKPILLSVGYAACHWCHVMAHESFENVETAALMNRLFVNIKVDREERPDIDAIYMQALHAMGEQGGWPLTMFLTPDAEPFWGGTYFPPEARWGRPSFSQVLRSVAQAFAEQKQAISRNTSALREAVARASAAAPGALPGPELLPRVAGALLRLTDPERGGLRGAPKFPNPPIFRLLWQAGCRTGDADLREPVHHLLRAMSQGGIYDHLGGGFARYSTDAEWLVPHFEKMLYDNAQILELLALAYAAVPNPLYALRAAETVMWLARDMTAAPDSAGNAAFAASEDADSEGEEGKFYVFSEAEVDQAMADLPEIDVPAFKLAYDVTAGGNWEHRTILRRRAQLGDAAFEAMLARGRAALLAVRDQRVRPGRDDKVLADWNGLAIVALCRAAAVFNQPDWTERAAAAFAFIWANMRTEDGRIQHAWCKGRITAAGLLDDQASIARAALALFEATANPDYLAAAQSIIAAAVARFVDSDGSFFTTADDAGDVPLVRPRQAADNVTPSGNGLMAENYARLHHLTGEDCWRRRCEALVAAFAGSDNLANHCTLIAALDTLNEAADVVIIGDRTDSSAISLWRSACAAADPAVVVLHAERGDILSPLHPAHGKRAENGKSTAYLCQAGTCGLPVQDPADLRLALAVC